jgi:hypothetical protein
MEPAAPAVSGHSSVWLPRTLKATAASAETSVIAKPDAETQYQRGTERKFLHLDAEQQNGVAAGQR